MVKRCLYYQCASNSLINVYISLHKGYLYLCATGNTNNDDTNYKANVSNS